MISLNGNRKLIDSAGGLRRLAYMISRPAILAAALAFPGGVWALSPELQDFIGNPAGDATFWALKSQNDMALDVPVANTLFIGAHNSWNALDSGLKKKVLFGPNQKYNPIDLAILGTRYFEIDAWYSPYWHWDCAVDGVANCGLYLAHGEKQSDWHWSGFLRMTDTLGALADWLNRPENANEIVILDIEDVTKKYGRESFCEIYHNDKDLLLEDDFVDEDDLKEYYDDLHDDICEDSSAGWQPSQGRAEMAALLETYLGDLLFRPEDRKAFPWGWPTRREILEGGLGRVIIFDDADLLDTYGAGAQTHCFEVDENGVPFRCFNYYELGFTVDTNLIAKTYKEVRGLSDEQWKNTWNPENSDNFLIVRGDSLIFDDDGIFAQGDLDKLFDILKIDLVKLLGGVIGGKIADDADVGTLRLPWHGVPGLLSRNVNILKMDWLLGNIDMIHYSGSQLQDAIGDLVEREKGGTVETLVSPIIDGSIDNDRNYTPQIWDLPPPGHTRRRFQHAVWSWAPSDPGPVRAIFQDLIPGDGTGDAQFNFFSAFNTGNLTEFSDNARLNGRDFAALNEIGSWNSALGGQGPYPFGLRADADTGSWRISRAAGSAFNAEERLDPELRLILVDDEDYWGRVFSGNRFERWPWFYAAPVNGFQNASLRTTRDATNPVPPAVWMNVRDDDDLGKCDSGPCPDGQWKVVHNAPAFDDLEVIPLTPPWVTTWVPAPKGDWADAHTFCDTLTEARFAGYRLWHLAEHQHIRKFSKEAGNGLITHYYDGQTPAPVLYWTRNESKDGTAAKVVDGLNDDVAFVDKTSTEPRAFCISVRYGKTVEEEILSAEVIDVAPTPPSNLTESAATSAKPEDAGSDQAATPSGGGCNLPMLALLVLIHAVRRRHAALCKPSGPD